MYTFLIRMPGAQARRRRAGRSRLHEKPPFSRIGPIEVIEKVYFHSEVVLYRIYSVLEDTWRSCQASHVYT